VGLTFKETKNSFKANFLHFRDLPKNYNKLKVNIRQGNSSLEDRLNYIYYKECINMIPIQVILSTPVSLAIGASIGVTSLILPTSCVLAGYTLLALKGFISKAPSSNKKIVEKINSGNKLNYMEKRVYKKAQNLQRPTKK